MAEVKVASLKCTALCQCGGEYEVDSEEQFQQQKKQNKTQMYF